MAEAAARLPETLVSELERLCPGGVLRDVPLAAISQWRIGGRADLILRPGSAGELARLRAWFHERGLPHLVIGATTNLLFADAGLRVPCLQIGARMSRISAGSEAGEIEVEAGAWVPGLARRIMQMGLTGAEHICGIPGTLGGLVCMNGGSQRKGIGSSILSVEAIDPEGRRIRRETAECGFAYRRSVFQENGEIVASARLRFVPADRGEVRREMLAILGDRRRKFPRKTPNCGSVFKSNPAMYDEIGPPGAAIERLGFKGRRIGAAQVAPLHANFIVNTGGAQAADVLALIREVRSAVLESTGYAMETEALFVGPWGQIAPADRIAPDQVFPDQTLSSPAASGSPLA